MKDTKDTDTPDKQTIDLLSERRRGRPSTGAAMTSTERVRKLREKLDAEARKREPDWTETLCLSILSSSKYSKAKSEAAWRALGELRGYKQESGSGCV